MNESLKEWDSVKPQWQSIADKVAEVQQVLAKHASIQVPMSDPSIQVDKAQVKIPAGSNFHDVDLVYFTGGGVVANQLLNLVLTEQDVQCRHGINSSDRDYSQQIVDGFFQRYPRDKETVTYYAGRISSEEKLDAIEARVDQILEIAKNDPKAAVTIIEKPLRDLEASRRSRVATEVTRGMVSALQIHDNARDILADVATQLGINDEQLKSALDRARDSGRGGGRAGGYGR